MGAWTLYLIGTILCFSTGIMSQGDTPNAFKIFTSIPDAVAISDTNADGIFECASAKLTDTKDNPEEATYEMTLMDGANADKKPVTFHITPGETLDRIQFYAGDNADVKEVGQFLYSNYKSCSIIKGEYEGNRCLLFVKKELKDDVPQECVEKFGELCGVAVSVHDRDLC
uniref:Lipocalin n=1 Tax=Rhipicephalus appendiculatus TaxID=34631 RepID=A0A131YQH6_RHIAP